MKKVFMVWRKSDDIRITGEELEFLAIGVWIKSVDKQDEGLKYFLPYSNITMITEYEESKD